MSGVTDSATVRAKHTLVRKVREVDEATWLQFTDAVIRMNKEWGDNFSGGRGRPYMFTVLDDERLRIRGVIGGEDGDALLSIFRVDEGPWPDGSTYQNINYLPQGETWVGALMILIQIHLPDVYDWCVDTPGVGHFEEASRLIVKTFKKPHAVMFVDHKPSDEKHRVRVVTGIDELRELTRTRGYRADTKLRSLNKDGEAHDVPDFIKTLLGDDDNPFGEEGSGLNGSMMGALMGALRSSSPTVRRLLNADLPSREQARESLDKLIKEVLAEQFEYVKAEHTEEEYAARAEVMRDDMAVLAKVVQFVVNNVKPHDPYVRVFGVNHEGDLSMIGIPEGLPMALGDSEGNAYLRAVLDKIFSLGQTRFAFVVMDAVSPDGNCGTAINMYENKSGRHWVRTVVIDHDHEGGYDTSQPKPTKDLLGGEETN